MSGSFDPYKTLGVGPNATSKEIKASYHKLCLQYHPDKAGPESHEKFVQVQEAFEFLYGKAQKLENHKDDHQEGYEEDHEDDYKGYYYEETPGNPDESNSSAEEQVSSDDSSSSDDDEEQPVQQGPTYEDPPVTNLEPQWYENRPLLRIRNRIFSLLRFTTKLLDEQEAHLTRTRQFLENRSDESKSCLANAMKHISERIATKKSELAAMSDQIEGASYLDWKNKPEIQEVREPLSQMERKLPWLGSELDGLERAVKKFESAKRKEKRLQLKKVLTLRAMKIIINPY